MNEQNKKRLWIFIAIIFALILWFVFFRNTKVGKAVEAAVNDAANSLGLSNLPVPSFPVQTYNVPPVNIGDVNVGGGGCCDRGDACTGGTPGGGNPVPVGSPSNPGDPNQTLSSSDIDTLQNMISGLQYFGAYQIN